MKLSPTQISFYHENGYLQIEDYFDGREIELLCSELPNTIDQGSPRIVLENNGAVRSIFAPHFVNHTYDRLARLERLVVPSEQLIESRVYLHQYKLNTKKGLKGDWWEWHQDFPYWHIDDGIENPELVSVMIYLQDTDSSNGALLLIPKTHKLGIVKFAEKEVLSMALHSGDNNGPLQEDYSSSLSSNIKFTVDHDLVKELATKNGIVTAAGKKGSVLFFHGNVFHASNNNLTPFDRNTVLLTYNSVNNPPGNVRNPRPEFLAARNCTPITNLEATI
jgi:ectoine hydroxylase